MDTSADSPDDKTSPCSFSVFVESVGVLAVLTSALTSPTLTVTVFPSTAVEDFTSIPPIVTRASPFGTAVVVLEVLSAELFDAPPEEEALESFVSEEVVVGSMVIDDPEAVVVEDAEGVVEVVVVVGG
jgi:hypothetical protein